MTDTNESYTDFLRRVADDFEEDGMHATAKDYREAARRIDNLVDRLHCLCNVADMAKEELERYGR